MEQKKIDTPPTHYYEGVGGDLFNSYGSTLHVTHCNNNIRILKKNSTYSAL